MEVAMQQVWEEEFDKENNKGQMGDGGDFADNFLMCTSHSGAV